jgi:cell fate regulator YaaT (PSP1 superfamily)
MHLVQAECYFNGSKVIFYFTAESRVDFRELVKELVQEFRTRVEMRQIGVRHETQMTGGIGACGRELCCASFLRNFESVSIKMAKAQDLPLNPAKISGVCNRLLCCLTYEFESYRLIKREMPRLGQQLHHSGTMYRVVRVFPMQGTVLAVSEEGAEVTLNEAQWKEAESAGRGEEARKKGKEKDSAGGKSFPRKGKKG